MARPNKQGLEYFPIDVDLDQDDKLQMIIGQFGYQGEMIYTKMLSWIYKNHGYYIEWDEMSQLKFATRIAYAMGGPKVDFIKEVIGVCVKWGLFHRGSFEAHEILTSERIQRTWFDASRKRKDRVFNHTFWLFNDKMELIPEVTPKKGENSQLIPEETTQSKVKESKLKESTVKEENAPDNIIDFSKVLEAEKKEKEKSSAQKEKCLLILSQSGRNPIDPVYEITWIELCSQPEFSRKTDYQLQRMCMDLMDYDEQFAINLMKKAIRNGYKDVIFDNTKTDYLKNQKNGTIKHIDNAATRREERASLDEQADRILASYQS